MSGHSLNEVEALAKRACRGAGYPWGLAEDTGKAVRWLAAHQLPGVALLADLLAGREGGDLSHVTPAALRGVWAAPSGTMCPLICGASLSDCAHLLGPGQKIEMSGVTHPLLLLPFAGFVARHTGSAVEVSWRHTRMATDGVLAWMDGDGELAAPTAARVLCLGISQMPVAGRLPGQRAEVGASTWDSLGQLAHRTYAPATEASRQRGAGAGASDND